MQNSLFSHANNLVEKGSKKLAKFQFDESITLLQEAKSIDPTLGNCDFYIEIAKSCKNAGLSENSSSCEIAEIWNELKAKMRDLGGAPEHYKETWIYFARRLRELDEFDAQGALANCKYFIHEGVCTLHLKKYPDAYEILKVAAKHYGDEFPARYWGYFGDAALAVKEYGKANNAYLKLLTINPFEIDWATLQKKKLRSVFKQLAEDGSIALAYANLPYFAWREEIIEVPQGDTFITEFVQKIDDYADQYDNLEPTKKAHLFALYAFADQTEPEANANFRAKMKALSPDLFKDYIHVITSR